MFSKFVVRDSHKDSSRKIKAFDDFDEAVACAKDRYNAVGKPLGFDTVVEETRYASEDKLRIDFHIDSHIRWASYFDVI